MDVLETPVLFLVFNRPDYAQKVFDQIRKARPRKLFIAADGPRDWVAGEAEKCQLVKEIVGQVDWECEVKTLFRTQNLGCGCAPSSAISWFFEHVEEGIILEDDCVPDLSFFLFCANLLEKYRDEPQVMMISGTSYLLNKEQPDCDYFFSNHYAIWGWATWKRAWNFFNFDLRKWRHEDTYEKLLKIFNNRQITRFWSDNFDKIVPGRTDIWDYQWSYACIFNGGLSISPVKNLISNIGLDGVHTSVIGRVSIWHERLTEMIDTKNMKHPVSICVDKQLSSITYKVLNIVNPVTLMDIIKFPVRKIPWLKKMATYCKRCFK